MPRDRRPYVALGGVAAALAAALLVPTSRIWLAEQVLAPLRAQADPSFGGPAGYSIASLGFWALAGIVLSWVAYDLVFGRLGYEPNKRFFAALAPWLVAAPLAHALLSVGAIPLPFAYLATEPPIYLTAATLVVLALLAGRAFRWPHLMPLVVGLVVLAALLVVAVPHASASGLGRVVLLFVLAAIPALVLSFAFVKWLRPQEDLATVGLVVGAHALDGATTWMVLRDPFGFGFHSFAEKNPVSLALVGLSNGWPFFVVKLTLPLVLLSLIKMEETERRMRAFLLFAVFVLGYGPGMSNLLQVMLG
ncbi:MAG: DUF63 family protein [Candidatus Thermoplasmatota archaeon]